MSNRLEFREKSLVFLMGVAGVGKSSIAYKLLGKICCTYIDNNALADAFFPNSRNSAEYMKVRPAIYRQLYRIVGDNLRMGNSVIVDAPFVKQMGEATWRKFIIEFAKSHQANLIFIKCICTEATHRSRLVTRAEVRDDWKLRNWGDYQRMEPIDFEIPFEHLTVDTEYSITHSVDVIVNYLEPLLATD